jgi:hypothetical protein
MLSLGMRNLICIAFSVLLLAMASCNFKSGNDEKKQKTLQEPIRKVSIEEIETGIKGYIQKKAQENGGYFQVTDRGREFRMKLVRVHTEYLANLGPKRHFACVDLADVSGDVYDVDFFLNGDPGAMDVTETTVHKLNGKPYYAWKQRADKTWHRVPVNEASTRILGVIEGSDAFEFYYRVNLPEINGQARMWMPIATSDQYQSVEMSSIKVPGKFEMIRDEEYGNTILYVEMDDQQSKEMVEITYKVNRLEKTPFDDRAEIPSRYLEPNIMMPVGGRFTEIAREAVGSNEGNLMQARALYDYIIDNMRYMKYGDYGRGDANYACDVRTGNCSEFHSFFISLARSLGIPARFAVGAAIPSERNDGGIDGYHCWAEFYAEGKWWPVDISEGNKYTALATYYLAIILLTE